MDVKVYFGLVPQAPPCSPDQDRQHLGPTQSRRAPARITGQVLGLELGLERFQILINGNVELEQRIRTAYLLLPEQQPLRDVSRSRTTALIP